ncbi:MAG TPA: VOC family protein [Candidatus Thermoplasmatota archaeon]|nr:VOC family protein [Candidatus Thermoplasmatota archaeon]
MRLDHCCLNVRDMDAAIRFYEAHFGMKLLSRREIPENDAEIAFVGYGGEDAMKLELTHWRTWKPEEYTEGSTFDHIAIVVDTDLRALVERLRAAGVKVAREPFSLSGGGSTIAFVHDLDGNWVELIERRR